MYRLCRPYIFDDRVKCVVRYNRYTNVYLRRDRGRIIPQRECYRFVRLRFLRASRLISQPTLFQSVQFQHFPILFRVTFFFTLNNVDRVIYKTLL